MNFMQLRDTVLPFIKSCKMPGNVGSYRYSTSVSEETLYSSTYAAMTFSLLGELNNLCPNEKKSWADYLNSFQDDDGLYRDPVIYDQGWYQGDPLWCGRAHLSCHVITALSCLGHISSKPFTFLDKYKDIKSLENWLNSLDFAEMVAFSGNEIMNVGTLLQYSRDFHGDKLAGVAAAYLLKWLSSHHINPETGLWGSLDVSDPVARSHAVQAAYHWWPLFFYDKYPVPYVEEAIDSILKTQNASGGFGWGVHNPDSPDNSSACEDIDSIDPLVRMSYLTSYCNREIISALSIARQHVLSNQMPDGGFVFMKNREFDYGHSQLDGNLNEGVLFPTWFRILSLALIDSCLIEKNNKKSPYVFTDCPGFQFWRR